LEGSLLSLLINVRVARKKLYSGKHYSLSCLSASDEENKFYNVDTWAEEAEGGGLKLSGKKI
jgi:hypothetical protein